MYVFIRLFSAFHFALAASFPSFLSLFFAFLLFTNACTSLFMCTLHFSWSNHTIHGVRFVYACMDSRMNGHGRKSWMCADNVLLHTEKCCAAPRKISAAPYTHTLRIANGYSLSLFSFDCMILRSFHRISADVYIFVVLKHSPIGQCQEIVKQTFNTVYMFIWILKHVVVYVFLAFELWYRHV